MTIAIAQDITARKRNEDDTQKQLKELTVLHSVALAKSIAKNVDELIQRVTDIIGDTLYPDNCGVLLLNETQDELKPHFSYRGTNKENLALSMPLTKGITGKVAATGISISQEMFHSNLHIMKQQMAYFPSFASPSTMEQRLLAF